MTRFLLLRHAAHDLAGRALAGRLPGLGLNASGQAQALAWAQWWQSARPSSDGDEASGTPLFARVDAIYSSPQQRTRETAQPIADALGLHLACEDAFDEIDFGAWTGQPFEQVAATDPEAWRLWCERRSQATPPGGEPFAAMARRAVAGIERLRPRHPAQCVLVVSHADVIKAVIASHLGLSLDALERFEIGCACVSVLDVGEGWSKLVLLNAAVPA